MQNYEVRIHFYIHFTIPDHMPDDLAFLMVTSLVHTSKFATSSFISFVGKEIFRINRGVRHSSLKRTRF